MFKIYCQKNTIHYIKHKKRAIKNITDKIWEKIGTRYCLVCKDYTDSFKPQEIKYDK